MDSFDARSLVQIIIQLALIILGLLIANESRKSHSELGRIVGGTLGAAAGAWSAWGVVEQCFIKYNIFAEKWLGLAQVGSVLAIGLVIFFIIMNNTGPERPPKPPKEEPQQRQRKVPQVPPPNNQAQ